MPSNTILQNYINLTQTPAEILAFVQKSKMAAGFYFCFVGP